MTVDRMLNRKVWFLFFWGCLVAAFGFRMLNMTGPIDQFSAWRQAETAYMTLRLAEETPPEFLHSKVPYRGAKDVHLAELPVQPLLTAYGYKLLGRESLVLARVVTLLFFGGGAWLLYLIFSRMQGRDAAMLGVLLYTWLPLGIGYSRAIHVDFCVLFFSYAYLYSGMRYYERGSGWYWSLSCLAATIAFAMKAPYCFFLGLPLILFAFRAPSNRQRPVRTILLTGALFVIPLFAALLFNWHRMALEADEVESLVYCMKWTPELSRLQFFGFLEQRFEWKRWVVVLRRIWWWVLTPAGSVLAFCGLLQRPKKLFNIDGLCVYGWYLGTIVYVLLVFPIFSSTHDYYSLPLLAPAAMAIALGIMRVFAWNLLSEKKQVVACCMVMAVFFCSLYIIRSSKSFAVDEQRLIVGQMIEDHTEPDELVLSVTLGRSTGYSDPRILYYAKRRGWAIELAQLDHDALALYRQHGAKWAALLVTPSRWPVADEGYGRLHMFERQIHPLVNNEGHTVGYLVLFDLDGVTRRS